MKRAKNVIRQLCCEENLVCIADSRDGVALYKTYEKQGKTRVRPIAVTPFAEALNPMAIALLSTS